MAILDTSICWKI